MKKRYLIIGLLVLALAVASLVAACGGDKETTTTAAPVTTEAPTTTTPGPETTEAPTTTEASSPETTVPGPATGEPIKIGLSTSLTGSSAAPGKSVSMGAAAQVEFVNANGGINGRPLEIVEYDDASEVPNAITNVNKMIQEDKVFMTIGPFAQYMQEPPGRSPNKPRLPWSERPGHAGTAQRHPVSVERHDLCRTAHPGRRSH